MLCWATGVLTLLGGLHRHGQLAYLVVGDALIVAGLPFAVRWWRQIRWLPPGLAGYRFAAPTTRPFRLRSWSPGPALIGPARGELQLPNGEWAEVDIRYASIVLIANLRAGAEPVVRGPIGPDRRILVGVAGLPTLTPATVRGATADDSITGSRATL